MKLRLRAFSSNDFSYQGDMKCFTGEMSDFKGVDHDLFQRIYDDAADVGFDMYSERTGKTETFYLSETKKDNEGDFMFCKFLPVDRHLASLGVYVIIFND